MNRLFVYGTLQQEGVQISVLGRKLETAPASLSGYKKSKVTINGNEYPIAVESKDSSITGKVINVTDEELQKLDEYETSAYVRIKIVLDNGLNTWFYCKPK